MIRLTCTQCKSVLEMDDAFAGGVCRCQHCGTIQTVPSHLKGSAVATKSAYQGAGAGQAGTGTARERDRAVRSGRCGGQQRVVPRQLDEQATGGRICPSRTACSRAGAAQSDAAAHRRRRDHRHFAGGCSVAGAWEQDAGAGKSEPEQSTRAAPPSEVTPPPSTPVGPSAPAGPHFLTLPIDANRIVYVIDRSDSAKQTLDTVKAALFNSIESLTPSREFAVVFWGKPGEKDLKGVVVPGNRVRPRDAAADRERAGQVRRRPGVRRN